VSVLAGLHELVASALPGLVYRERLAFSRVTPGNDDEDDKDARIARLTRQLVDAEFNLEIGRKRILPNVRAMYFRRHPDGGTLEDAREFISSAPKPDASHFSQKGGARHNTKDNSADESAGAEVVRRTRELMEQRAEQGRPLRYEAAAKIVFEKDRDLLARYLDEPGVR